VLDEVLEPAEDEVPPAPVEVLGAAGDEPVPVEVPDAGVADLPLSVDAPLDEPADDPALAEDFESRESVR